MAHAFSSATFATGSWEGLLILHLGLLFFSSSPIEHCVDNGAGVEGRSPIGQFSSPPCFPTISSSFPSHFLFLSLSFSFRHARHHLTISPSHPLVSHHLTQLLSQFPSFAPTHASAKVLRQNAVSLVIPEQFLRYRGSSFRIF